MKKPDTSKFAIAKPSVSGVKPIQFIKQSITELKKVSWPTRQETTKLTLIVIAVSTLVGLYIGGLDYIFTKVVESIIK